MEGVSENGNLPLDLEGDAVRLRSASAFVISLRGDLGGCSHSEKVDLIVLGVVKAEPPSVAFLRVDIVESPSRILRFGVLARPPLLKE